MATSIAARSLIFPAAYYDGLHPYRHLVELEFRGEQILVRGAGIAFAWPTAETYVVADGRFPEPIRLERKGGAIGEALLVDNHMVMDVVREHPEIHLPAPPLLAGIRGWPAVILTCVALVVLGSVLYTWGTVVVAEALAAITPPVVEERIGRAVVNIMVPEAMRCQDERLAKDLQPIIERLQTALGDGHSFEILYSRHSIPNAFAAPGRRIVVFHGLLDFTQTPEELAAVLAHEMMHVEHRHSIRALTRHVSAQALLSMMAMDSAGTPAAMENVVQLGNLRYQRDDEDEADLEGARLLRKANIDPKAMATFFRRLSADARFADAGSTYFSSHPALMDRVVRVEAEAVRESVDARPLLSAEAWNRARQGCRN